MIAAPLFIISHPPLTLAQCLAGGHRCLSRAERAPEGSLLTGWPELTEKLAAARGAEASHIAPPRGNQIEAGRQAVAFEQ